MFESSPSFHQADRSVCVASDDALQEREDVLHKLWSFGIDFANSGHAWPVHKLLADDAFKDVNNVDYYYNSV